MVRERRVFKGGVGGGGVMSLLFPDPRFWVVLCYCNSKLYLGLTVCIHRVNIAFMRASWSFFSCTEIGRMCSLLTYNLSRVVQNDDRADDTTTGEFRHRIRESVIDDSVTRRV